MKEQYDEQNAIDIITETVEGVRTFIKHQYIGDGKYRYSYSGDIPKEDVDWGVGATSFALKLMYLLDTHEDNQVCLAINRIKNFQQSDGYIYDNYINRKAFAPNFIAAIKGRQFDDLNNSRYKRAESRQCHSSMLLYGELPDKYPVEMKMNRAFCIKFLERMDWSKPWASGSHMSHLLFYLKLADLMRVITPIEFSELRKEIVDWVNKIQDPLSGSWYIGKTTDQQKINGAMKVITGFYAAGITEFMYAKQLIDLCLKNVNNKQACDNFNIIYVLHKASLLEQDYRREEIEQFALDRLNIYMNYYHREQGGFSFYEKCSNKVYYGAKVSKGYDEADMHGTTLFMWGISIICQILGIQNEIGIREFLT